MHAKADPNKHYTYKKECKIVGTFTLFKSFILPLYF